MNCATKCSQEIRLNFVVLPWKLYYLCCSYYRKQASGDIREILARGTVNSTDLKYLDCLGTGVAGTVYKAHHLPTQSIISVKVWPNDPSVVCDAF